MSNMSSSLFFENLLPIVKRLVGFIYNTDFFLERRTAITKQSQKQSSNTPSHRTSHTCINQIPWRTTKVRSTEQFVVSFSKDSNSERIGRLPS